MLSGRYMHTYVVYQRVKVQHNISTAVSFPDHTLLYSVFED